MELSKKIKYYRDSREMSQKELARRVGVEESKIIAWEDGKEEPNASEINSLNGIFGVNMLDNAVSLSVANKESKHGLYNALSIVLFIFSLASIFLGLVCAAMCMPSDGYFEDTIWVLYIFATIPIASLLYGILIRKKYGKVILKNIIAGAIMSILLFIFGSIGFMPSDTTNGDDSLYLKAETTIGIDLPEYERVSLTTYGDVVTTIRCTKHATCTAELDAANSSAFEKGLDADGKWLSNIPNEYLGLHYSPSSSVFDSDCYYIFYNVTTSEINTLPVASGNYDMISITYDSYLNQFTIAEYTIKYVK